MTPPHHDADAPFAVVSPLREEIAPFLSRLVARRTVRVAGRRYVRGLLGRTPVLAGTTGDGARGAAETLARVLDAERARGVVVLGVAGALTHDLAVGHVLVADEVLRADAPPRRADEALLARVPRRPWALRGAVVQADRLVATPDERRSLRDRWARAPASVDLESAALAEAALARGLPFVLLRAISDAADERLPRFLVQSADADGRVRRGRLVGRALLAPARVGTLWRLARRMRLCAGRLAELAEGLLAGPPGADAGR